MSKWIAIWKKPPKIGQNILIAGKYNGGNIWFVMAGVKSAEKQFGSNLFYGIEEHTDGACMTEIDPADVTHWMPLPEPPDSDK
jgi:hypothetical protein